VWSCDSIVPYIFMYWCLISKGTNLSSASSQNSKVIPCGLLTTESEARPVPYMCFITELGFRSSGRRDPLLGILCTSKAVETLSRNSFAELF
jgi:hypothetical protein